ncbi:MAG: S26 family signal peptidase [Polyangiales bacterium]
MKGWMKVVLWIVLTVGPISAAIRYFFLEFYDVPDTAGDMHTWANAPTVEPGDYLATWRGGKPHLGELVLCSDPQAPGKWMMARVIGVAGDLVEQTPVDFRINHFRISYNPCVLPSKPLPGEDGVPVDPRCQSEEIGGRHDTYLAKVPAPFTITVEPGKLFLMSDNRGEPWSYDSRMAEVGTRPEEECPQRVFLRVQSKLGWSDSAQRMTWLF